MKLKRYIRRSSKRLSPLHFLLRGSQILGDNRGITLVELLVGSVIALIVMGFALSGALVNRQLFLQDQVRSNVNQTLRSGLDIIGADIQQIGENLGTIVNFPALQVTNSGGTTSSEMIIRRRPLVALTVCQAVTAGGNSPLVVAIPGSTEPGCAPTADSNANVWPDANLELWRNYRLANDDDIVRAYIFNGNNVGEFFNYSAEDRSPNTAAGSFRISRSTGNWTNNYSVGSLVFLVEERRYRLCPASQLASATCTASTTQDNTLQLIVNDDLTNPIRLTGGLQNFVVRVINQAAPTTPSLDYCWQGATRVSPIPAPPISCTTDTWSQISSVTVDLTARDSAASNLITTKANQSVRTLSKEFFPRNVLSF